jgi:hypothetical protein
MEDRISARLERKAGLPGLLKGLVDRLGGLELQVLRFLGERGFLPVELSPAAAFGSCSVVATVDQHKVISALRNTEIVADATNALALHIAASVRAAGGDRNAVSRLCTVHRHIRTQPFPTGYFPHFKIGCMVSSGLDTGNYVFELESVFGRSPMGDSWTGRSSCWETARSGC